MSPRTKRTEAREQREKNKCKKRLGRFVSAEQTVIEEEEARRWRMKQKDGESIEESITVEKKGGETKDGKGNIKGQRTQTGRGKNRMVQEETIRRKRHREKTKRREETNRGM